MTGDYDRAVAALSEARGLLADLGSRGGTAHVISALGSRCSGRVKSRKVASSSARGARERGPTPSGSCSRRSRRPPTGWAPPASPAAATGCWAVVDAQRALVPDRTYGSETGLYSSSRARDRDALAAGRVRRAREEGGRLTLDEGLDCAIAALDRTGATAGRSGTGRPSPRSPRPDAPRAGGARAGRRRPVGRRDRRGPVHQQEDGVSPCGEHQGQLGASSRVEMAMLARGMAGSTMAALRAPATCATWSGEVDDPSHLGWLRGDRGASRLLPRIQKRATVGRRAALLVFVRSSEMRARSTSSRIRAANDALGGDFSGIRRFAERDHYIVRWMIYDHGGNFSAHMVPDLSSAISGVLRRVPRVNAPREGPALAPLAESLGHQRPGSASRSSGNPAGR